MRNIYLAWLTMWSVALSSASSGISVVLITLAILAWNRCQRQIGKGSESCGRCKERTMAA
jgi:hypothetical protein